MSIVINTNAPALNAIQNLEKQNTKLNLSMEKLSSGLKINGSDDNSANLATATRMAAQIGSLIQASANAQAGVSLINIADSALDSISESITALRTLAIQAANGTLTPSDRTAINANAESLLAQINSTVDKTNFNGLNLLDGTLNTTLQVGTQAGDTIGIHINSANTADIGAVIVKGDPVQGSLIAGDLSINGAAIIPSSSDNLSYVAPSQSAIAIANAINASGTDVQASANPNVTGTSNFISSGGTGGKMTINGVDTSVISISADLASNVQNAIVAINAISTETGVEASANVDGKLVLTAPDGRNITVSYGAGIENGDLGAVAADTITSSITLSSSSSITIGGINPANAGLVGGTTSTLTSLSSINFDSQVGAIAALPIIDEALNAIGDIRSNIGAIENRLYSTIDTLSNNAVNLLEAKSQIMDTDFAVEMANFAKLQILQQASTTVLAYANIQPQNILKLLS